VSAITRALRSVLEIFDHAVALELRDLVDEEHSAETVDLVREGRRGRAFGEPYTQLIDWPIGVRIATGLDESFGAKLLA